MGDNDATLLNYKKSPDDGHSYPEVVAQPDYTDPTWQKETNPLYETLPDGGKDARVSVRNARRMSPTGAPAAKKRLEGQSTIYGEHSQPPPISKKTYRDRGPVVKPQSGRRKASGVVACGAAVLFVGLALVLSIAALVLFVFLFLGILPLPSANQVRVTGTVLILRACVLHGTLSHAIAYIMVTSVMPINSLLILSLPLSGALLVTQHWPVEHWHYVTFMALANVCLWAHGIVSCAHVIAV